MMHVYMYVDRVEAGRWPILSFGCPQCGRLEDGI